MLVFVLRLDKQRQVLAKFLFRFEALIISVVSFYFAPGHLSHFECWIILHHIS